MKAHHLLTALLTFSSTTYAQTQDTRSPSFVFETLSGQEYSHQLNNKRDRPLYLKFWATWCSYCIEEMPHSQTLYNAHNGQMDFVAVNVGMNDSLARINKYFSKHSYTMPVAFDEQGDLVSMFNIVGTPQHVIIDTNGHIIHRSSLITDDIQKHVLSLISQESQ